MLEVDEVLGVIPSYWVHPEYAGSATAYHRTVIFECTARVAADPAVDWPAASQEFVTSLGLTWNPLTTQIEGL